MIIKILLLLLLSLLLLTLHEHFKETTCILIKKKR